MTIQSQRGGVLYRQNEQNPWVIEFQAGKGKCWHLHSVCLDAAGKPSPAMARRKVLALGRNAEKEVTT